MLWTNLSFFFNLFISGFTFEDDPTEDLDALIGKSNLKKQESVVKKPPIASSSTGSNLNKNVKNSISFDDFDEAFLTGK